MGKVLSRRGVGQGFWGQVMDVAGLWLVVGTTALFARSIKVFVRK